MRLQRSKLVSTISWILSSTLEPNVNRTFSRVFTLALASIPASQSKAERICSRVTRCSGPRFRPKRWLSASMIRESASSASSTPPPQQLAPGGVEWPGPAGPARFGRGSSVGCGTTPCRCSAGPRAAAPCRRSATGAAIGGRRCIASRDPRRRRSAPRRGTRTGGCSRRAGRGRPAPVAGESAEALARARARRKAGPAALESNTPARKTRRRSPRTRRSPADGPGLRRAGRRRSPPRAGWSRSRARTPSGPPRPSLAKSSAITSRLPEWVRLRRGRVWTPFTPPSFLSHDGSKVDAAQFRQGPSAPRRRQ